MSRTLAVMAKYWQPGLVKTRLARTLGERPAAQLYRSMLETMLARLDGSADRCILSFTPARRREEFERLAPASWQIEPQVDGDLGARMRRQMDRALQSGAERVVLLGSDSPTVPLETIRQAFEKLSHAEVVLGPTTDGGYYLIGAAGCVPDIFAGIEWSTDSVWEQTLERLAHVGCSWEEMPAWYDVDDEEGLNRLGQELAGSQCAGRQFDRLRQCYREIVRSGRR